MNIKDRIQKLTSGMQKKDRIIASAFIIALAIAFGLGLYAFRGAIFLADDTVSGDPVQPEPTEPVFRHPLTGEITAEEHTELPRVFGIMIDHSVDAWPQAGIDQAFFVIEAPVEAGIPRLLAFFHEEQEVEKIGPVRSARPYYVRWNNGLDALYAHVGGSNEALDLIASNGTFDLNQFYNGGAFWRVNDRRFAPHNVYTSTDRILHVLENYHETEERDVPEYGVWKFADGASSVEEDASGVDVTIDYSFPAYRVHWQYDRGENRYKRLQAGFPYTTEDDTVIWADNVAVIVTHMEVIDRVGRRHIMTEGEGEGYVFQNGDVLEGVWKKPSEEERLRFYDADGDEIVMNAGTTWVEVVSSTEDVMFDVEDE